MGIKLSASNIAWPAEKDQQVYEYMQKIGFQGLEIAPTRVFQDKPYDKKEEAKAFAKEIKEKYGLEICSMQSLWYGHNERIFGTNEERQILLNYTKQAIAFAEAVGARNLVFGCPKNRCVGENDNTSIAVEFFRELGNYASECGTVLAMEANPFIYGTNYINRTKEAVELIKEVGSKGFKLNLDFGTVIYNEEKIEDIAAFAELINHVHISEPNLKLIEQRGEHRELLQILKDSAYHGFVSIEMSRRDDICDVMNTIDYLAALGGA